MAEPEPEAEKKKNTVKCACGLCDDVLAPDHPGIKCPAGHHMSTDCSGGFIEMMLKDELFPPKCPHCSAEYSLPVIERNLKPEQMEKWHEMMIPAAIELERGEDFAHCPKCSNMIIRDMRHDTFFPCGGVFHGYGGALTQTFGSGCGVHSCFVCKREVKPECISIRRVDDSVTPSADVSASAEAQAKHHQICRELEPLLTEFEDLVSQGASFECPNPECDVRGMKDDACTHMRCDGCSMRWCYICNKLERDCNAADDGGSRIYRHNVDWETNANRCPMYLHLVHAVDARWPADEEGAKHRLHSVRTLNMLRQFRVRIGDAQLDRLWAHFESVGAHGYTKEQLKEPEEVLIQRRDS